jgi:hypothetical protein
MGERGVYVIFLAGTGLGLQASRAGLLSISLDSGEHVR